jgi:hypothetical protein
MSQSWRDQFQNRQAESQLETEGVISSAQRRIKDLYLCFQLCVFLCSRSQVRCHDGCVSCTFDLTHGRLFESYYFVLSLNS